MAVGPAAEEHEVENRELDAVLGGEDAHQLLLVQVGELLGIIVTDVVGVDAVDFGGAHLRGDLADQLVLQQTEVAVGMVEGHGPLVGEEDVPLGELRGVFERGAVADSQEGLGQDGWQGATRDGQAEASMAVQGMVLAAEDV